MNEYPVVVEKIQNDIYVDDLVPGCTNLVEVENLKKKSIELLFKGFNLPRIYHRLKMTLQILR